MSPQALSIGASTSVFGLLGVICCYYSYNWHKLGVNRGINLGIIVALISVNFLFSIVEKTVDLYGHLGGFIGGVCLGTALMPQGDDLDKWKYIRVAAWFFLVLFVSCFLLVLFTSFEFKSISTGCE